MVTFYIPDIYFLLTVYCNKIIVVIRLYVSCMEYISVVYIIPLAHETGWETKMRNVYLT